MDVQSAFAYNNPKKIFEVIERVSKKGAILRSLPVKGGWINDTLNEIVHSLTEKGWEVYTQGGICLIAKKI